MFSFPSGGNPQALSSLTALAYEQLVASNARTADAVSTAASNRTRLESRREIVLGGQPCAYVKLIYANYLVSQSGGGPETNTGNAYTLEASIEIPTAPISGPIRVTFGGANVGTVPDGTPAYISDPIYAGLFGLA